jgi:hypothetical protein
MLIYLLGWISGGSGFIYSFRHKRRIKITQDSPLRHYYADLAYLTVSVFGRLRGYVVAYQPVIDILQLQNTAYRNKGYARADRWVSFDQMFDQCSFGRFLLVLLVEERHRGEFIILRRLVN